MSKTVYANNTAADLNLRDARTVARQDAEQAPRPSTAELLRAARTGRRGRYPMTGEQVIARATDAARLSLTGDTYSAEDVRDCAAELVTWVWSTLPQGAGWPTSEDSRYDLSTLRGRAQNWRRSLDRKRATDAAEAKDRENRRAASWAASVADAIDRAEDARLRAQESAEDAARAADLACERLGMERGAAVWSVFYQWARNEDGATCAAECGVRPGTWRERTAAAGRMIRALYPSAADLLPALTGAAVVTAQDGAVLYTLADERTHGYRAPGKLTPPENYGPTPVRPSDAEQARELCTVRHTVPRPLTRKLARRAMWRRMTDGSARLYRRYPRGPHGQSRTPSKLERVARARRVIGATLARPGARERGVQRTAPATGAMS